MALHVCLAGTAISSDWAFIRRLRTRCCVSLVARLAQLHDSELVDSADAVVIDCGGTADAWLDALREVRRRVPSAPVILLDGGITQEQVASGLGSGAVDYFPEPYPADLLLQRVEVLAQQGRASRRTGRSSTSSKGSHS